ncbi:MAG: hypothetical protein ACOYNW_02825 [Undibacterium curvum]|jgi:hypothetical protein|uniref:Uncharacterized protein n=1 Tax=Undibacterium curvum TaxID=2762294 RepID=A0ABR7A9N0_9BURK|nr:hypothetical protein [Undibacterium curvum]MBC3933600.1 hypothetical protein [Undibacterium curvum]
MALFVDVENSLRITACLRHLMSFVLAACCLLSGVHLWSQGSQRITTTQYVTQADSSAVRLVTHTWHWDGVMLQVRYIRRA